MVLWIHPGSNSNRAYQIDVAPEKRQKYQVVRIYGKDRMRRFKSMKQAQRFVTAHAAVSNLFNLGRHLVRAQHYRDLRINAFAEWSRAVA